MPETNGNLTVAGQSSYGKVEQDHSYETDLGYAVLPIASRTPGWRRIRLHGGIGFRRVKWTASRAGVPPIIPTPTDTANDYILSSTVTPSLPTPITNEAGYNWHVSGEYLYVQRNPRQPQDDTLPTGGFPFPLSVNDSIAAKLVGVWPAFYAAQGNPSYTVADLTIKKVAETVDHGTDRFLWPFTTYAPVFTSSNLIGA